MTSLPTVAVRDGAQLEDRLPAAVDLVRLLGDGSGGFHVERQLAHAWLPPNRPRRTLAITTTTSMTPMNVT